MILLHHERDLMNVSEFWSEWNYHFTNEVLRIGMDDFLSWNLVRTVMFHDIKKEAFDELKNSGRWGYFSPALQLDGFGAKASRFCRNSSGNLLHHVYSLNEFLKFSPDTDLKAMKCVYEVGGGYGSLCRLFFRLGFDGKYIILDNPVMSSIQERFLTAKVPGKSIATLYGSLNTEVDMAIALWSLSECPLKSREKFFNSIKFKKCLIAFQKDFFGMNNLKYFKGLMKQIPEFRWTLYEIKHIPDNFYLLGEKK